MDSHLDAREPEKLFALLHDDGVIVLKNNPALRLVKINELTAGAARRNRHSSQAVPGYADSDNGLKLVIACGMRGSLSGLFQIISLCEPNVVA